MDSEDPNESSQLEGLTTIFRDQLLACLEECAQGRRGLFAEHLAEEHAWPDAEAPLRELRAPFSLL